MSEAVASALAAGAGLTLHLLELAAAAGAAVPGGHVMLEPGDPFAAVPWVLLLGAGLWSIGNGNTAAETGRRLAWVTTAVLWGGLLRYLGAGSADSGRHLALHFLDVGQGDGAVLRTPGGRWVVIDAGPALRGSDAGRRVVAPFLARRGVRKVAAVFVSHAHADHLGGVPAVLRSVRAGLVVEPATLYPDPLYLGFLGLLAEEGIAWHPGRAGECFRLDGVAFTILHPGRQWTRWGEDVNEDSLVLLVEYGEFQALFAGDAGFPAEELREPSSVGGSAQGRAPWEPRQHRRRLAGFASAVGRGHLGRAEQIRPPLAPDADSPGRGWSRRLAHRSRGSHYSHDRWAEDDGAGGRPGGDVRRGGRRRQRSQLTSNPIGGGVQTSVTTIERFILDQEDRYPEATGELSNLLYDIALAAKIIAAAIRRAGLVNILGTAGNRRTCRARSSRSWTSSPTRP